MGTKCDDVKCGPASDVEFLLRVRVRPMISRKNMAVDLGFCGPEEIRTPDLTRARCAEVTYGYAHAFTFSAIPAGQSAFSDHRCLHPFPPTSNGDVEFLLRAEQPSGPGQRG